MATRECEAIIIKSFKLGEHDKIVVALTREFGKLRLIAKGARGSRSRYGASLEPFSKVSLVFYFKEGRELLNVQRCELLRSSFTIASDAETLAEMSYATELIEEFVPAGEPNQKVYRLLDEVLKLFENVTGAAPLLRYFEVWVLRLSGFFPDLGRCAACSRLIEDSRSSWVAADGSTYCVRCRPMGAQSVDGPAKRTVKEILRMHPREFLTASGGDQGLHALGCLNRQLIRHHLERELKSYSQLR